MIRFLRYHSISVSLILVIPLTARVWAADGKVTCVACHKQQAEELSASIHDKIDCQECHGGESSYAMSLEDVTRYTHPTGGLLGTFDHGSQFLGKPDRAEIPERCGSCHEDVERMNPYGLRTDQLSRYWTSGHGKTLATTGDTRVAVCVDCHGSHQVMVGHEPASRTYPLNVPDTCGRCHADSALMGAFGLPVEVVEGYRQSVHGRLLFEQNDTGAPTCATCHGNHSATPPGFAEVGAVCGQCHQHAAENFASSVHAGQEGHKGCVQCHGGGEEYRFHRIERITKPSGLLIQRYIHLLANEPNPTDAQVSEVIHPDPKQIITQALPGCLECHEELDEDESLPKLFLLLDEIASAERRYVETGRRLAEVGQGVLLVERQQFMFEDAKTHLIELAPLQHTLDNEKVAAKVAELNTVCDKVNLELDELERVLRWRHAAVIPVWVFCVLFAILCYAKYKQLKADWVKPSSGQHRGVKG